MSILCKNVRFLLCTEISNDSHSCFPNCYSCLIHLGLVPLILIPNTYVNDELNGGVAYVLGINTGCPLVMDFSIYLQVF